MTKPFESIRQLFGRVLGNNQNEARDLSTLGIGSPEAHPSTNGNGHSNSFAVENSQTDLDAQTADTQRLPQVAPEFIYSRNGGASRRRVAHEEGADEFGDALLDLGDVRGGKAFAGDDPFLDVLDETAPRDDVFVEVIPEATVPAEDYGESVCQSGTGVSPVIHAQDARATATEIVVEVAQPETKAEESAPVSSASPANLSDLSPEAIDAIAHRVVAQLSDKVVREIAWEVVPELAELLIKQKLEEK
jgi:hypothetical protein